jgi:hypothetical protein
VIPGNTRNLIKNHPTEVTVVTKPEIPILDIH